MPGSLRPETKLSISAATLAKLASAGLKAASAA
jgi:hypothetical protein